MQLRLLSQPLLKAVALLSIFALIWTSTGVSAAVSRQASPSQFSLEHAAFEEQAVVEGLTQSVKPFMRSIPSLVRRDAASLHRSSAELKTLNFERPPSAFHKFSWGPLTEETVFTGISLALFGTQALPLVVFRLLFVGAHAWNAPSERGRTLSFFEKWVGPAVAGIAPLLWLTAGSPESSAVHVMMLSLLSHVAVQTALAGLRRLTGRPFRYALVDPLWSLAPESIDVDAPAAAGGGRWRRIRRIAATTNAASYVRNSERKERYIATVSKSEPVIGPGRPEFEAFKNVYDAVKPVFDRILRSQAIDPSEYRLLLFDDVTPNAAVIRDYDVALVHMGLLRLLVEAGASEDELAFVLSHEVVHVLQQRAAIDAGKEPPADLFTQHAKDRADEYHADLVALRVMSEADYSVRAAPIFFRQLQAFMESSKLKELPWGDHPATEERIRRLEQSLHDTYWPTYLKDLTPLSLVLKTGSFHRARHRRFQESVYTVQTSQELVHTISDAAIIDEAQFAMVVGYYQLNEREQEKFRESFSQVRETAWQLVPRDPISQYFAQTTQDQAEDAIGIERAGHPPYLEARNPLKKYSNEQLLEAIHRGVPPLFLIHINVEPKERTPAHDKAVETYRQFMRWDRNKTIKGLDAGAFEMFMRREMNAFVKEIESRIESGRFTAGETFKAMGAFERFREQLRDSQGFHGQASDAVGDYADVNDRLILAVIRAVKHPQSLSPELLTWILKENAESGQERADWLHHFFMQLPEDGQSTVRGWLRNQKTELPLAEGLLIADAKAFHRKGKSILTPTTDIVEYLRVLGNFDWFRVYDDNELFSFFREFQEKESDERLLEGYEAVLRPTRFSGKLSEPFHPDTLSWRAKLGEIFRPGDAFEQKLLAISPKSLHDRLLKVDATTKLILLFHFMGIRQKDEDLRTWLLNPTHKLSEPQRSKTILLIADSLRWLGEQIERSTVSEDRAKVMKEWDQYAYPFYLRAFNIRLGGSSRFPFPEKWSRLPEEKEVRQHRPWNAQHFGRDGKSRKLFRAQFDFIKRLPRDVAKAQRRIVTEIPIGIHRNFILYETAVQRLAPDLVDPYDLTVLRRWLASVPAPRRQAFVSATQGLILDMVFDEILDKKNVDHQGSSFYREAYGGANTILDSAQYDAEKAGYADAAFAVPGGPVSQLRVLLGVIGTTDLKHVVTSSAGIEEKMRRLTAAFPDPSSARDELLTTWLEQSIASLPAADAIRAITLFSSESSRMQWALEGLEARFRTHSKGFGTLDKEIEEILRFFPEPSPVRDDILTTALNHHWVTWKDNDRVLALLSHPMLNLDKLQDDETARSLLKYDAGVAILQSCSASEKVAFFLWVIGATDEKPEYLKLSEYRLYVNYDHLRDHFLAKAEGRYREAWKSTRRESLQPFLYGKYGILGDPVARRLLQGGIFTAFLGPSDTIASDAARATMESIFNVVFEKADDRRREEILLGLLESRPSLNLTDTATTSERRQARAARVFLQSLGLIGVKLGQFLSESPGTSAVWREELATLKNEASSLAKFIVFDMIRKLYGNAAAKFVSIGPVIGRASIKVVFLVRLIDGLLKVLKVKRPEIEKRIEVDMTFLGDVLPAILLLLEKQGIRLPDGVQERLGEMFREELDFEGEARNQKRLLAGLRSFRGWMARLWQPMLRHRLRLGVAMASEVAGNSLMIESYEEGQTLDAILKNPPQGYDADAIRRGVAKDLLRQIFVDGFYHADAHGRNIIVKAAGYAVYIDVGSAATLSSSRRRLLRQLISALVANDSETLTRAAHREWRFDAPVEAKLHAIAVSTSSPVRRLSEVLVLMDSEAGGLSSEFLSLYRLLSSAASLFESLGGDLGQISGPKPGRAKFRPRLTRLLHAA